MTKKGFIKQVTISSVLALAVLIAIVCFTFTMFKRYSPPSKSNTTFVNGTVKEVYYTSPTPGVFIEMTNGETLELIYNMLGGRFWDVIYFSDMFQSTVDYSFEQFVDLLEGNTIKCKRLMDLPWIVEIFVDDTVIDNTEFVVRQITFTRVAIIIVDLIMLALLACFYVPYINKNYKRYNRAEKKRLRKEKRLKLN